MAKLTLNDISSGFISNTAYNTNNTLIETALENTLSRDGTAPNGMAVDLDMNSHAILNATGLTINGINVVPTGTTTVPAASMVFTPTGNISSTNVQTAIQELDTEKSSLVELALSSGSTLIGNIQSGIGAVSRTVHNKIIETISVKDFGAVCNGIVDDTISVQKALTYGASLIGGGRVIIPSGGICKCNSGLILDTGKVVFDLNGGILDFSSIVAGSIGITIVNQNIDGNLINGLNHAHPISFGTIIGPGGSINAKAIKISYTPAPTIMSGGEISNILFLNWGTDIEYGDGAFCITFRKCNFIITSGGSPTTYSILMPSVSNGGERNLFIDCMWNNRDYVLNQSNGNSDTYFIGCSFDYSPSRVMTITGGTVHISSSHIEQSNDIGYWFYVSGNNSLLTFSDVVFTCPVAKNSFSPCYSDNTSTQGGIEIINSYWTSISGISVPLVAGTGRAKVSGLLTYASQVVPFSSYTQNLLAFGGFESASYTSEWTLSAGAVRNNINPRTGTYSLVLDGTAGNPAANTVVLVRPGQHISGELWYLVPAITGTSATLFGTIIYQDKAGNTLASNTVINTQVNAAVYTRAPIYISSPAPSGTYQAYLNITVFGRVSGSPIAYIDDVILTALD